MEEKELKCGKIDQIGDFVGRHWGDFVGSVILVIGTVLVVLYAMKTGDWAKVESLGASLTGASLIVLKLRNNPKPNGNGNGDSNGKSV